MEQRVTKDRLQNFVLDFDDKIVSPLDKNGYERNKFNVFDILNTKRKELRYSDFLAFLFDPSKNGEIGQQFLRSFLSLLAKENPELNLDFFKMFYEKFDNVIVKREYKNIDILIDVNISGKKYVFIIENKVDAGEQLCQLAEYKSTVDSEYKNSHNIFYLFLSPDKREPSESDYWTAIDYNLVYSALDKLKLGTADNTVRTLVTDFKKFIRGQFEMAHDKELREVALKIYKNDKDVFDLIFTSIPNRINTTADIIRDFLSKIDWIVFDKDKARRQNANILFTTKGLEKTNVLFQFKVGTMEIYAYAKGGSPEHRKALDMKENATFLNISTMYFFGDKGKNDDKIKEYENFLLERQDDELRTDCLKFLDKVFAVDGEVYREAKKIEGRFR